MSASAVLRLDLMACRVSSRLDRFESSLVAALREVRFEVSLMRADMRQMEQRLIIKLGGMMVVMVGVVVAIVKLLPGGHP